MKRPQSQQEVLWSLIRNLTTAEKKSFLKKFKSSGFTPLYARLFEWICHHDAPDEETLLRELGPGLNRKNLNYTRFYLQAQLLETLGRLEIREGGQALLIHNVSVIKKLFQHGQHTMALRLWKQTLKLARKYEDYTIVRMLKDEYLNFEIYFNHQTSYSNLLKVYYDHFVNYEEFSQTMQLEELCYASILICKKSQFDLNSEMNAHVRTLSAHPLLQSAPGFNPFLRYHFWSLTNGIVCYLEEKFEMAVAYFEPLIAQWHKSTTFIAYRPQAYLEVLYNYANAAIRIRRFTEAEKLYHHPVNKLIKDEYHLRYFTILKYHTFLRMSLVSGDFARVNKLLNKLKPFLISRNGKLQADLQRPLLMSTAISSFVMEKFQDADAFARQSLTLFPDKIGTHNAGATHLFLLLVCYEMKDEWLFQIQFKTCYQYYYRQKCFSGFEKELMSMLKKTFSLKHSEKAIGLLRNSLSRLDKINCKAKQEICSLFNFPAWISSRIEGMSCRDYGVIQKQSYSELY